MSIEWKSRSTALYDHVSQDLQILLTIASRLTSCAQIVPKICQKYQNESKISRDIKDGIVLKGPCLLAKPSIFCTLRFLSAAYTR